MNGWSYIACSIGVSYYLLSNASGIAVTIMEWINVDQLIIINTVYHLKICSQAIVFKELLSCIYLYTSALLHLQYVMWQWSMTKGCRTVFQTQIRSNHRSLWLLCIIGMFTGDFVNDEIHIWHLKKYSQTSNIRWTLGGNKIVDHSDIVGTFLTSSAPTTASFYT